MTRLDQSIDAKIDVDRIVASRKTTDTEAAYVVLSCSGWTDTEICEHFEWSHNRPQTIKSQLRRKFSE